MSCCNGVCVSTGAGAVVVWWLDRHRAAGFTATVRRPEQRDGHLQCVTEPEGQVAYGSSTATNTNTPSSIRPRSLEDTTHPTNATPSPSMDQRPTANMFLGKQIYTLSLFQYLNQNEEKVVLFLRETQEFSILEYIYQEKERRAIFLDRRENILHFFLFQFVFFVQAMQAVFCVASSVVPTTVINFFFFSRTKCLLTQMSFCMLRIYNSKPLQTLTVRANVWVFYNSWRLFGDSQKSSLDWIILSGKKYCLYFLGFFNAIKNIAYKHCVQKKRLHLLLWFE